MHVQGIAQLVSKNNGWRYMRLVALARRATSASVGRSQRYANTLDTVRSSSQAQSLRPTGTK